MTVKSLSERDIIAFYVIPSVIMRLEQLNAACACARNKLQGAALFSDSETWVN